MALVVDGKIGARPQPLPYNGKDLDALALGAQLLIWDPGLVIVELQQIRSGQSGAMSIGANYGRILATLEIGGWPYRVATPLTWKRVYGIKAGSDKKASFAAARRVWGRDFDALGLGATKEGLVEAMLIAGI